MSLYSVVVPVYNSEHTLGELYTRLEKVFRETLKEDFELILVDDGSKDRSYEIMTELREKDHRVRIIQMARNFGQHPALLCGFAHVKVTTFCADHPIDQDTAQGDPFATYMYTIFLPEVAVNTETGKVKVEKFTCVADVGTIMNRLLVEGNFYGGLVQGIGLALTEDFEDLNHDTSLKNCGIPYPNDAPDDIELHFNETYRPSGPYGAAGCGEAPLDAPHPAILNAIYNATGARITRVPARPEKVLAALKELEK